MRRLPLLVSALTVLAAPTSAPASDSPTGGAAAPSPGGGATHGQPLRKVRRVASRPSATAFTVAPGALEAGTPARFTYRVDSRARRVRVRIELTDAGAAAPAVRLRLGYQRTGVEHTHVWTPAPGELPAGEYAVALRAFDDAGHALRRTATASGRGRLTVDVAPPPAAVGSFPVRGAYSFGADDARFGAARSDHVHQGQDVIAVQGTPVVAPVAGSVYWVAFQAKGAGHYVVLRAVDGHDYVFMHLAEGSIAVLKGAPLAAGETLGAVGSTGASSGPHLHFEIWPDGWHSSTASAPIDPLPQLIAWAGTR